MIFAAILNQALAHYKVFTTISLKKIVVKTVAHIKTAENCCSCGKSCSVYGQ